LIENHETCPIGSTPFPKVYAATFDLYFHDRDRDIDYGHGYKGNFKEMFCHQKWHNNVKKEKGKCENIDKNDQSIYYHYGGKGHLSCTYCTPKYLTNNEKNIETHFAYEDGDSDYGHMETLITSLVIGYESVKKNLILIFMFIWRTNVCTSTKGYCLIDSATTYTILKSNKFFSCLIMRDINVSIIYSTTNIFESSGRTIILLPRSWIETY